MIHPKRQIHIIYDDRQLCSQSTSEVIGVRPYGDILYRRKTLSNNFKGSLPSWVKPFTHHIKKDVQLAEIRKTIESAQEELSIIIISACAGISDFERFNQLVERLPFAENDFLDRRYQPLLLFYKDGHDLISDWNLFEKAPINAWDKNFKGWDQLDSIKPLDLSKIQDFLSYISGATEARHFNQIEMDRYYYTKRSTDKNKMEAEYRFYSLVPEQMRPWLIQPFSYQDEGASASYKMLRFFIADAALQWIHSAFNPKSFEEFIDKALFFIVNRPRKKVNRNEVSKVGDALFLNKVEERIEKLLSIPEGKSLNDILRISNPELEIEQQLERYKALYAKSRGELSEDFLSVGHGDPCFSNMLYEQKRNILTLIDPKGAIEESQIWTHPMYDLCKLSHSVLGNYDFINNGLFSVNMNSEGHMALEFKRLNHEQLKSVFYQKLAEYGFNWRLIRLTEASLFLSMLPLHLDHSNKVIAFMINAKTILDQVEKK